MSDQREGAAAVGGGDLLDRLVREVRSERNRLARLSERVTGQRTQATPREERERLLARVDRVLGGGDRAAGRLMRVTLLFREEQENVLHVVGLDGPLVGLSHRERSDEVYRRVSERLRGEDAVPWRALRRDPAFSERVVRAEALLGIAPGPAAERAAESAPPGASGDASANGAPPTRSP